MSSHSRSHGESLWAPGGRWLSPIAGGLLGCVYCVAVFLGTFRGWYWFDYPNRDFNANPWTLGVIWGFAGMAGGAVAGVIAEVGAPLAAVLVATPLVVGSMVLTGSTGAGATTQLASYVVVVLIGAGLGVSAGSALGRSTNVRQSPAGIWWRHWLYLAAVAYYLPVYLIATLQNIWIDLRLGWYFTFTPRMWFSWRTWLYVSFLSWFAAVPTYILAAGYVRMYEVLHVNSGYGRAKKFNAFWMYFLTVPTIVWVLT